MASERRITRRRFLGRAAGLAAVAPLAASSRVLGANERITLGAIGVGGRGRDDLGGFLGFGEVQVLTVCDVVASHRDQAKAMADRRYGNSDCTTKGDFREVLARTDIDAVLVATPDHWHSTVSIEAMRSGKDVFCEKPETLTVRQGRRVAETARRLGRVFSGGSQRVWEDYNWYHRMVRGGAIGDPLEAWVNVGGPSGPCHLPPVSTPAGVD